MVAQSRARMRRRRRLDRRRHRVCVCEGIVVRALCVVIIVYA